MAPPGFVRAQIAETSAAMPSTTHSHTAPAVGHGAPGPTQQPITLYPLTTYNYNDDHTHYNQYNQYNYYDRYDDKNGGRDFI